MFRSFIAIEHNYFMAVWLFVFALLYLHIIHTWFLFVFQNEQNHIHGKITSKYVLMHWFLSTSKHKRRFQGFGLTKTKYDSFSFWNGKPHKIFPFFSIENVQCECQYMPVILPSQELFQKIFIWNNWKLK